MNKRLLLILLLLLLASAAIAYYNTARTPPPAPPQAQPPQQRQPEPQAAPLPSPVAPQKADEAKEQRPKTVEMRLEKPKPAAAKPSIPDSIRLEKRKARELIPGVMLEDKEVKIQLERANESLNIRRDNSQVEVLWKQKF